MNHIEVKNNKYVFAKDKVKVILCEYNNQCHWYILYIIVKNIHATHANIYVRAYVCVFVALLENLSSSKKPRIKAFSHCIIYFLSTVPQSTYYLHTI